MTAQSTAPTRTDASSVETALLARLGLLPSASSQDVEAAHDALLEFLEAAPSDLRVWARLQVAAIDEAFALLSDPTIDRTALAAPAVAAAADVPAPTRTLATAHVGLSDAGPQTVAPAGRRVTRRLFIGAAAIVAVIAIAIAGFNLNGGAGVPPINGSPAPQAAASPGVDPAQVTPLMEKIKANPNDVASLQALADLYYQADDYATAGGFLERIVAIDPKNVVGLLALGAVDYNQGDVANAEKQWRSVLAIDDRNVDAHYYLGFMYLSKNPPDMASVKLEWAKVVAIAPDSNIAKSVAQHLASLEASPTPAASGGAASPAPSVGPAATGSPVASPAPSGN